MRISKSIVAVAAATTLALTGCGADSGSDGGSSGASADGAALAEEAAAMVDEYRAVPTPDDLGAPIDISELEGETIYSIPIDSGAEFYADGEAAMAAVAEEAGVDFVTFPSDGTQTSYQQGIQQAINAGAGAILLNGPLPETLGPQIDAAKDAGIPVVPLHINDMESGTSEGLEYEAFAPFNLAARLMTLDAIAHHEGAPVNALIIQSSETGPAAGMVETMQETLDEYGPEGSKASVMNVAVPQWSTRIQDEVQSNLLRDPTINTVLPIYDNMATYASPGIQQAAAGRDVPIFTFNGTPSILQMVANGTVAMNVAENPDWVAHVNMDTAFRAMLGEEPIEGVSGPVRVIDETNVEETGNPPRSGEGFGDEYRDAYRELWGLI
ncbi:ribose transport system substrate-binding protein [Dietzia sp. 2505]|uniref:sugar ABC transporter substrate-binding protein n=1 Tax=Dietzia sp. 2505 TaxID=3156457 RepID=UPI0033989AB1